MPALEKLRGRVPESLVEIVRLPGLGAKTARRLWQELDITTLEQLEAAAREGRLQGQAGPEGPARDSVEARGGIARIRLRLREGKRKKPFSILVRISAASGSNRATIGLCITCWS